jgi:hypothetical protein
MKDAVFWDIKTRFIPHRIHYFYATEPSQLMLYKILDIPGRDFEEFRLLEYENPVHTSQETHYNSDTGSIR